MTRINLVDPAVLINEHLMAEYRELPRIFRAVIEAHEAGKRAKDFKIPPYYVLGTGHVTFFYNKTRFLAKRWESLLYELERRRFNLDFEYITLIRQRIRDLPDWSQGDYIPTPEDVYLNMKRITDRWWDKKVRVEVTLTRKGIDYVPT